MIWGVKDSKEVEKTIQTERKSVQRPHGVKAGARLCWGERAGQRAQTAELWEMQLVSGALHARSGSAILFFGALSERDDLIRAGIGL